MTSYKTIGVLVAILGVLTGVAYWDEYQTKQDEKAEKQKNKILTLDKAQVSSIFYSDRESKTEVALLKEGEQWKVKAPLETDADKNTVENLLTTVLDYKHEKVVGETKESWGDFGVADPSRTIELISAEAKKTLYIGDKAPVGYSVYFRLDDSDKVYIGSQYLLTSTNKKLADFRERSVARIDPEKVKQIEYAYAGKKLFAAELLGPDTMKVMVPEGLKASRQEVADFLSEIRNAKADSFLDQPDSKVAQGFASAKERIEIDWTNQDGSSARIEVVKLGGEFLVKSPAHPNLVKVTEATKNKLNRSLFDFRDKSIADFESADVATIEVDGKVYENRDGDYFAKDAGEKAEKASHIKDLVVDISFAKAQAFDSSKKAKSTAAKPPMHKLKLTFTEASKKAPLTIAVWEHFEDKTARLVRADQAQELIKIGQATFASVSAPEADEIDAAALPDLKDNG